MNNILLLLFFGFMSQAVNAQIFTKHDPDDSNLGNYITQIAIDGDKVVCASRGDSILCVYDGNTWTRYGRSTYGFAPDISAQRELVVDGNGDYWIAHYAQVDQFDGNTVTNYNENNSELEHDFMRDIAVDNDGRMFFAYSNGNGVSILEDGEWTHDGEFTDGLAPLNDIFLPHLIEVDQAKNEVWIFDGGEFLQIIDDEIVIHNWQNSNIPSLGSEEVKAMTVTEDGKVWFAITDFSEEVGGLLMYDGSEWSHLTAENDGLPDPNIACLTSYGNQLIVGGYNTGFVSILDNGEWTTYDDTNSNFPAWGATFYEMKILGDKVFIGTGGGVYEMNLNAYPTSTYSLTNNDISTYPNPVKDLLNIEPIEGATNISLLDLTGRLVRTQSFETRIDLSSIRSGCYYLLIQNKEAILYKKTLFKE